MNVEEAIQANVNDVMKKLLARFQAERDRIVAMVNEALKANEDDCPTSMTFEKSAEFNEIVAQLLMTPLGSVEVLSPNDEKIHAKPSTLQLREVKNEVKEAPLKEKVRVSGGRTKRFKGSDYGEMDVVAVVEGNDHFGDLIESPSAIVTIPNKSRLALLHGDRISVLTASAKVKATYKMQTDWNHINCWRYLDVHPETGRLFCIDRGQIKAIKPRKLPANKSTIEAKTRVSFDNTGDVPYGMAICGATEQLFTCVNKTILSYSLSTFDVTGKYRLNDTSAYSPSICGVNRHRVFCCGESGAVLNSIPLDEKSGRLIIPEMKMVTDDFAHHSPIAFDPEDHILVANRRRHRIQVLSPSGHEWLSSFGPNSPYAPSDIAIVKGGPNELFSFENGEIQCSRVVVTPDYAANRVVFFGLLQDDFI